MRERMDGWGWHCIMCLYVIIVVSSNSYQYTQSCDAPEIISSLFARPGCCGTADRGVCVCVCVCVFLREKESLREREFERERERD